jgi:hypothetical protein
MTSSKQERAIGQAGDLTDEPWPFDREDLEIEYRHEEWEDK